ncbi:adenosine deaminase [Parasteatoda tepidariorum]|uniref:adenosine deaminase n=1 Tax=Parasteatoda tepidariorum TaxID=114398 RepID=UPI001C726877|nr:adenosine deaminase [Parasteatoda tepidariorum]
MAQFIEFDSSKQPRCKVELHAHLEGSVRCETIWEIAEKKGFSLKCNTLEEFFHVCSIRSPSSLEQFLLAFAHFVPVIVGDVEAIERVAYEFCEDLADQNVIYSEVRYCPHLLCSSLENEISGQLTPRDVVMCVNKGLNRGAAKFKLSVRSILCCFRPNPEWSQEILDLCQEFKSHGVVGIDVAGDEAKGLADKEIIRVFKLAESLGIHRTAHAGEAGPSSNVQTALEEMKAERIGHGYHVVDDPDLYKRCLNDRVHFETCPYSSCLTGSVPLSATKHPIVRFAEDGANFSISRDDPTVIQKTLDQEYEFLRGFGLKDVHFTRANFNAARACFLPEDEKKELLMKLAETYGVQNICTVCQ